MAAGSRSHCSSAPPQPEERGCAGIRRHCPSGAAFPATCGPPRTAPSEGHNARGRPVPFGARCRRRRRSGTATVPSLTEGLLARSPRRGMRGAGTAAAPQHAVQRPALPCPGTSRSAPRHGAVRPSRALRVSAGSCVLILSKAPACHKLVSAPSSVLHIRPTCHHGRAPSVPHYVLHTASHEGQRVAPQTPQPRTPRRAPRVNDPHASLPLHAFLPTRAARSL